MNVTSSKLPQLLPGLALLLFLGSWGSFAQEVTPEKGPPVTVALHVQGVKPEPPLKVTGVAEWFGKEKVEPVRFDLGSVPVALDLRPGRWVLKADAPGDWGAPFQLELGGSPASVQLDLWPAGRLEGEISWEGNKPPSELGVFFRPTPTGTSAQTPPPGRESCQIERQTWRCQLPAGSLDLRFQAAGFIPRYQWGVQIEAGKLLHPGRIELRQGSAVQGWIVTNDRTPATGTRVTLRPRIAGSLRDEAERKRLESLRFDVPVSAQGFFQVDGVPPGAYLLEASNERFAPAVVSVRVLPGEVTEIANPPLLLTQPKVIEVFVEPPVDPAGQPWRMKLQKMDRDASVLETFAEEPAATDGAWRKKGVPAGDYVLRISRSGGGTWWAEPLVVDENPAPLHVRMEIVTVKGTVHLGKKPLAAKVAFGGRFGAVKVEAQSNQKGVFETFLPHAGSWPVHIASEDPAVQRELSKLKIEPKPGTSVAEIELRLPDTILKGRVMDESNDSIPGAIITANAQGQQNAEPVQAIADKEGHFEIRGLPLGPALIQADAGEDRFADPVTVDVQGMEDTKSWILVARPQLRVSGIVSSPLGPVPGARIKAAPAGIPYLGVPLVTSDAQGRFEVRLPRATQEMLLAVGAPGFALRMLRIPVPENRTFGINLEQTGGTVRVEPEEPFDPLDPESPRIFLLHGGSVEAIPSIMAWAAAAGGSTDRAGRSLLPGLEPGSYQACLIRPSERAALEAGIVPGDRCASGLLAANGELRLKLPPFEARSGRAPEGF